MLAVLGLMLVAANAEVFFQEDFTGTALFLAMCMASRRGAKSTLFHVCERRADRASVGT